MSDHQVRGLWLTVLPSGILTWSVRFRFNGRYRRMVLGRYHESTFGIDAARKLGAARLREVAEGRDPQAEKIEMRRRGKSGVESDLLVEKVYETYKARHLATLRKSTQREIGRMFDKRILPKLRKYKITEVTNREVLSILDSMVASGAPVSANRALAIMSHFFNWCVGRLLIATSPCVGIKRPTKQVSRSRVLSDLELSQAWRAVEKTGWPFSQITQLLILTGQRREEVAAMAESEVSDEVWTLPAERSKNHREHKIYLGKLVRSIIEDSPRVKPKEKGKPIYIFSTNGKTPPSGFSRAKLRLDSEMLKIAKADAMGRFEKPDKVEIAPWTLHDLRRTFASGLARLGVRLEVTERCLNHVSGSHAGVVGIYQRHDFAKECEAAWKLWAAHVAKIVRRAP